MVWPIPKPHPVHIFDAISQRDRIAELCNQFNLYPQKPTIVADPTPQEKLESSLKPQNSDVAHPKLSSIDASTPFRQVDLSVAQSENHNPYHLQHILAKSEFEKHYKPTRCPNNQLLLRNGQPYRLAGDHCFNHQPGIWKQIMDMTPSPKGKQNKHQSSSIPVTPFCKMYLNSHVKSNECSAEFRQLLELNFLPICGPACSLLSYYAASPISQSTPSKSVIRANTHDSGLCLTFWDSSDGELSPIKPRVLFPPALRGHAVCNAGNLVADSTSQLSSSTCKSSQINSKKRTMPDSPNRHDQGDNHCKRQRLHHGTEEQSLLQPTALPVYIPAISKKRAKPDSPAPKGYPGKRLRVELETKIETHFCQMPFVRSPIRTRSYTKKINGLE